MSNLITVFENDKDPAYALACKQVHEKNEETNEAIERRVDERERKLYEGKNRPRSRSIDEWEKMVTGIGQGLERTCLVYLHGFGNRYCFLEYGIPAVRPGHETNIPTIEELAKSVHRDVEERQAAMHGTTVKPFLYTFAEQHGMREQLKEFWPACKDLWKDPGHPLEKVKLTIAPLVSGAFVELLNGGPLRGLDAQERAAFEEIYNHLQE